MRQVVERITCDIGGEVSYSDSDTLVLRTEQFSWQGKSYEFDTCGRCFGKVGTWSIHSLIEKSRQVGKQGSTKVKPKPKTGTATNGDYRHDGEPPEVTPDMRTERGVTCPCGHQSPSTRGFKMHWSTRRNQEAQLKAVS